MSRLVEEYRRIGREHDIALCHRAARVVLGSSVIRVFKPGTKDALLPVLASLPVREMVNKVRTQEEFRTWFESALGTVHAVVARMNSGNSRIEPGAKWGHCTKVLALFLREVVLCARLCTDEEAKRFERLLYVPLDNIVMGRMRELGALVPCNAIKAIETAGHYYAMQDQLMSAAATVGVPAVWFDDTWTTR